MARDTEARLRPAAENLIIGAGADLGDETFWMGLIDDVRIRNQAVKPWTRTSSIEYCHADSAKLEWSMLSLYPDMTR